jgi:hypothetical protein
MGMNLLHKVLIGYGLVASTAFAQVTPAEAARQTPRTQQASPAPVTPPPQIVTFQDSRDANQTREQFQRLVRQYSPSLTEVFRLDPSLLSNAAFLAPYPNLAAFLNQHPEISHNPSYYVGETAFYRNESPERRSTRVFEEMMAAIAVFTAGVIILSVFSWVVRTVIDHRRWLRVSKVQSEVHSKLLDRFTTNQDLLSYIQTPAGRHFLESAPISIDSGPKSVSAPLGRILFSVQVGIVLTFAGVGLNLVSQTLGFEEVAQPLYVLGALGIAVGVGFVLSALVAYVMSRRMGLINNNPLPSASDNAGVSPPHA